MNCDPVGFMQTKSHPPEVLVTVAAHCSVMDSLVCTPGVNVCWKGHAKLSLINNCQYTAGSKSLYGLIKE